MSSPVQFTADAYIEKMDLDVIHIQTEAGVGMFGRQMAKVLHIPIVYTYHTMYEDYTHYFNPLEFDSVEKLGKSFIRAFHVSWPMALKLLLRLVKNENKH